MELKKVFNKGFVVSSREELNQTYYKMLNVEGLILNILMGLILVVAMFNSVGAIIILIVEKRKVKLGTRECDVHDEEKKRRENQQAPKAGSIRAQEVCDRKHGEGDTFLYVLGKLSE